jgi:hypothetical protein
MFITRKSRVGLRQLRTNSGKAVTLLAEQISQSALAVLERRPTQVLAIELNSGKLAITGLEGIDLHRLSFVVDDLVYPRSCR